MSKWALRSGACAVLVFAVGVSSVAVAVAVASPAGAAITGAGAVEAAAGVLPDVPPIVSDDPLPNAGPLSAPADPDTPDAAPTPLDLALDQARTSGERVEVVSLRTASVVVFANPKGTITEETRAAVDATVSAAVPVSADRDGARLRTGTGPSTGPARSFVEFSPLAGVKGRKVVAAQLRLFQDGAGSCGSSPLRVQAASPLPPELSWSAQPAVAGAPVVVDTAGDSAGCAGQSGWKTIDVTVLAPSLVPAGNEAAAVALSSDETDPGQSKTFRSAETADAPVLSVESLVTPDVPSELHPVDGVVTSTLQPTLRATVTAPGYAGSIVARFQVFDDADAEVVAHDVLVESGKQVSWTVPAKTLRPARAYTWKVTACTGFLPEACSEPAARKLSVDPGLAVGSRGFFTYDTTSISDRSGLAVNVASGNVSVTVADLALPGVHVPLSMNRTYNSLSTEGRDLGRGWSGDWSRTVRLVDEGDGSKTFMGESGEAVRIKKNGDGTYTPSGDLDARFVDAGGFGVYVLEFNHDRDAHSAGDRLYFHNTGPNRNRLWGSRDRNDAETLVEWADDQVASVTDTVGRKVVYGHGAAGRITIRSVGGHTVSYGYGPDGDLTSVTDAEGNATTYGYSGHLLTKITSPGGAVIDIAYDARGRATSVTRTVAGVAEVSKYSYDDTAVNGLVRSAVTDARGHISKYFADHANRVAQAFDAAGKKVAKTYDDNSNVTEINDANQTFTYAYSSDNRNNLEKVTAPMGATATASYDKAATKGLTPYVAGSATDPQGNKTTFSHDGVGNLLRTQNALAVQNSSRVERHGVDGVSCPPARKGQVCASFDARNIATRYGYDTNGQVTKVDHPAPLGDVTMAHDGLGRVTAMTDGKAQKRTFTYDRLDRLTAAAYPSKTISYSFDPAGNTTKRVDGAGTWAMAYDEANRLRSIDGPGAPEGYPKDLNDVSFAYDPVGNLTSLTDIGGTTRYSFTNVNLTETVADPDGGVTRYHYGDAYHAAWLTSIDHANGASSRMDYDGNGRIERVLNRDAEGKIVTDLAYEFTKGGHDAALLSKVTAQGGATTYGYDAGNRLTTVTDTPNGGEPLVTSTFAYDGAGNRTKATGAINSTYSYNDADQLATPGVDHDANGNMVAGGAHGYTTTVFNDLDQATSITPKGGEARPQEFAGQLQSHWIADAQTRFTTAASLGITATAKPGELTTFVRDPQGRLVSMKRGAQRYHYLTDGRGSIDALTDAKGQRVQAYRYDPWGRTTVALGGIDQPFRWNSEYAINDYDYKIGARYYDASLGRWTQRDPSAQDPNPYAYANNDPIDNTDPSGLGWCPLGKNDDGGCRGGDTYSKLTRRSTRPETEAQWRACAKAAVGAGLLAAGAAAFSGGTSLAAIPPAMVLGCASGHFLKDLDQRFPDE
ncbi:MAG: hypothetical protein JWM47_1950 [Acidimicrobiales bacterium]|nr:hypothetical protein [Acidimicrobiales bacterium]